MRLTRIFLLAALLLATGTTASAKKPIPIERYQKNIMRIVKQQPFYNPAHEYVFMYLPFKEIEGNPYEHIQTGQDLLEHTVRIFPDVNNPNLQMDLWLYDADSLMLCAELLYPFATIYRPTSVNIFRVQYLLQNNIQEYFFLGYTSITTFFMVRGNQVFVSVKNGQEPFKVYLFEDYIEQFGLEPIFGPRNRYDR